MMATYTNLSILQGWLEIESAGAVFVQRSQVPVLTGWIYTTDRVLSEDAAADRHSVMITGRAAEAVVEMMRKIQDKFARFNSLRLVRLVDEGGPHGEHCLVRGGRPFVIAQGKLINHGGHSRLDVRHISLLGAPWGTLEALEWIGSEQQSGLQALVSQLTEGEQQALHYRIHQEAEQLLASRTPD
jgi:hypothetical protein